MSDSLTTALADLVTNGTITQDQADQITAMNANGQGNRGNRGGGNQGGNGSNGGGQAGNGSNVGPQGGNGSNGGAQGGNGNSGGPQGGNGGFNRGPQIAGLTDDQRAAVQKAQTDARAAALASLVIDGTLTQDEADSLTQTMQNGNRPNRPTAAQDGNAANPT